MLEHKQLLETILAFFTSISKLIFQKQKKNEKEIIEQTENMSI